MTFGAFSLLILSARRRVRVGECGLYPATGRAPIAAQGGGLRPGFTLLAYAAAFLACAIALATLGYGDLRVGLAALLVGGSPFVMVLLGRGSDQGHLRTCTAIRGCSTACRANRTSSTPPTTCMATRDDTTSTDRMPSTALDESTVCADSWMQVPSVISSGSTGSKQSGVFMARSVPGLPYRNNFNRRNNLKGHQR